MVTAGGSARGCGAREGDKPGSAARDGAGPPGGSARRSRRRICPGRMPSGEADA